MEINGYEFKCPNVEVIPFIRNGEEFFLRAQAVLDYSEFEKLCPSPKPPEVIRPGGDKSIDINDKTYLEKVNKHSTLKYNWMCLKSLEATDGLKWKTIDMGKPETWDKFEEELKASFFTESEIFRIVAAISQAQGLNDIKIQEALKHFLAGQGKE